MVIDMEIEQQQAVDAAQEILNRSGGAPTINENKSLAALLTQNAVILNLTRTSWGIKKKLEQNLYQVEASEDGIPASKEMFRAQKKLIDSDEYDDIVSVDNEITALLDAYALPNLGKRGTYFLPKASIEYVDAKLWELRTKREAKVKLLAAALDGLIRDARMALGGAFRITDYPTPEGVEARYQMKWSYIQFAIPEDLPISMRGRAQQQLEALMTEAAENVGAALRENLAELLEEATDALTGSTEKVQEDGTTTKKPKIFRDSKIDNIRDFLDRFNARNITNDRELEQLVKATRALLDGIDTDSIRKDKDIKTIVSDGFKDIRAAILDSMEDVESRTVATRRFALDD